MKKFTLITCFTLVVFIHTRAQNSINSCGIEASSSTGTVSATIGQVFVKTNNNPSGEVAEGVQHAYEIFLLEVANNPEQGFISVYPNPVASALVLSTKNFIGENLSWKISDFQGKTIQEGVVQSESTIIDTARLANSIYFLRVLDKENNQIQLVKIVKH